MRAFFLSALLVGLAGAFYAHYILLLTPSAVLGADLMVLVVAMTLVGGIGTIAGPILGAFLLTFGIESLRAIGDWRMLVYGALIMAVTLLRPLGLASIRWRRPRAVTPLPAPSPARDMPGP